MKISKYLPILDGHIYPNFSALLHTAGLSKQRVNSVLAKLRVLPDSTTQTELEALLPELIDKARNTPDVNIPPRRARAATPLSLLMRQIADDANITLTDLCASIGMTRATARYAAAQVGSRSQLRLIARLLRMAPLTPQARMELQHMHNEQSDNPHV